MLTVSNRRMAAVAALLFFICRLPVSFLNSSALLVRTYARAIMLPPGISMQPENLQRAVGLATARDVFKMKGRVRAKLGADPGDRLCGDPHRGYTWTRAISASREPFLQRARIGFRRRQQRKGRSEQIERREAPRVVRARRAAHGSRASRSA